MNDYEEFILWMEKYGINWKLNEKELNYRLSILKSRKNIYNKKIKKIKVSN